MKERDDAYGHGIGEEGRKERGGDETKKKK